MSSFNSTLLSRTKKHLRDYDASDKWASILVSKCDYIRTPSCNFAHQDESEVNVLPESQQESCSQNIKRTWVNDFSVGGAKRV